MGERVPYVVVYGSPGLPLIQLVRRSVYHLAYFKFFDYYLGSIGWLSNWKKKQYISLTQRNAMKCP